MNQTKLSSERQLPTRKSLLLNLNSALSASGGFFTSSIFWILLVLFMFELGLNVIKPMRFVKLEGIIFQDQDTLNNKVEYLFSQSNNRNIYLFGTSLIDYASCDADFVWQNSRRTSIERSEYHNAEYLDHRLHEKLSLTTQSLNLGVPGCLMSGQKLLLEKAIEKGKQPPVVILCVAPRTFIDKTKQEGLDNIDCCFKRRDFNITKGESLQSAVDNICNQNWRYFRQRADYATVFTTLVENYFNRPTNAYVAKSWKKKNLKFDASNEIYNPKMADDQESIKGNNVYYKLAYDNPDNEMFGKKMISIVW